jgi:hypothetical protein
MKRRLPPNRLRRIHRFTLSGETAASLVALAEKFGISRSRVIDRMIRVDYSLLFGLFRDKVPFQEIVIRTGYEPGVVRAVWREWRAGFEDVEAPKVSAALELERLRLARAEVIAAGRERRALLSKSARAIEAEASVRREKIRASAEIAKERR